MSTPPFHTVLIGTFIRTFGLSEVLFSLYEDIWLIPKKELTVWVVPPQNNLINELTIKNIRQKFEHEYVAELSRLLTKKEAFAYRKHSLIVRKHDVDLQSPRLFEPKPLFNEKGVYIGDALSVQSLGKQTLLMVQMADGKYIDVPYVKDLIVKEDAKCFIMKVPKGLVPYMRCKKEDESGARKDHEI